MGSPNEVFPFLGLGQYPRAPLRVGTGWCYRVQERPGRCHGLQGPGSAWAYVRRQIQHSSGYHTQDPSTEAGKKWTSLSEVIKKVSDVGYQAQSWKESFSAKRTKMNPFESKAFQEFVQTSYTAFNNAGKKVKTADLPRQFSLVVKEEQKKALKKGEDLKWQVVQSQSGGSHGVLFVSL